MRERTGDVRQNSRMRRHFFEGVALNRQPRSSAWILAYFALVVADMIADGGEAGARHLAAALIITIAAGGLWQWLNRSDLAARLFLVSVLVVVSVVLLALPGGVVEPSGWPFPAVMGLVTGLVFSELGMRRLERRRSALSAPVAVAAAP